VIGDDKPNPSELAALHATMRRRCGCVWLALFLMLTTGLLALWLATGNRDYLYSACFYPLVPLWGFIYFHFFLFRPKHDPVAVQHRLEQLHADHLRNVRKVALVNGALLLVASPCIVFLAMGGGYEEYGILGAALAAIVGLTVFVALPLAMIAWARRSQSR
jgi:hypothetical protein